MIEDYTLINYEDYPSDKTPRNAEHLNKMDKGIQTNRNYIKNLSKTHKRLYVVSNVNQDWLLAGETKNVLFNDVKENTFTGNIGMDIINGGSIFTFSKNCKVRVRCSLWGLKDDGYIWARCIKLSGGVQTIMDNSIVPSVEHQPFITLKLETPEFEFASGDQLTINTEFSPSAGNKSLVGGQYQNAVWIEIEILEEL